VTFADVHVALACAATGDEANLGRLADELSARLAAGRLPAGEVVLLLVRGLAAYARGDWNAAVADLERALPDTVRIGGSRAQRDVVENTLLAAYVKAGRPADAQRLLAQRVHRRPAVEVAGFSAS
jgi:hypothetical protein